MKRWEDLGNDRWKYTISDPDDPSVISVFRGTKEEIFEKLADSQLNAGRRISELRKTSNGAGTRTAVAPHPQPLSPAERLQTVADLTNPAAVERGVTRVLESVVGPVSELRQGREDAAEERQNRAAIMAATGFANNTPEWYPSDHNKNTLVRYLQTQGMDPTNQAHYIQAFEELSAAQLLEAKPAEATPQIDEPATEGRTAPKPTQPPTPTRFSTSIRQSDISGTPPKPVARLKYSREQLAQMSAATYKRLMQTDPELSRCVEQYAQQDRRRKAG